MSEIECNGMKLDRPANTAQCQALSAVTTEQAKQMKASLKAMCGVYHSTDGSLCVRALWDTYPEYVPVWQAGLALSSEGGYWYV